MGDKACHGPHMYDEWIVGDAAGDPTNMEAWARLYRDAGYSRSFTTVTAHASPHDTWLMAPPVMSPDGDSHVFIGSARVWSLPSYRLGGLYAPANAEFNTPPFRWSQADMLWLNADARWKGVPVTGGCDEGCAAYIMVELCDASTREVIPGFEKENLKLMNTTGLKLPLRWKGHRTMKGVQGHMQVRARIYFRDATIYAMGIDRSVN